MKTFFVTRISVNKSIIFFVLSLLSARVSFIVEMLNHNVENFRNITRSSLDLDMRKRVESNEKNNFFGHEVNEQNSDVKLYSDVDTIGNSYNG